MARNPGPGVCVHCLREVPQRNWDHVFPVGWYPDTTPQNVEKWKIPTCKPCNDEYGRIEEELGIVLSTSIDPRSAKASGIWAKTLRAMNPLEGKNEKDRKARAKKKEKLLALMRTGENIPDHGIYPGLGERWHRPRVDQTAVLVPARYFQKLAEKIVKGLAFIEDSKYLDADVEIEHHVVMGEGAQEIEAVLAAFGEEHSRGPGILIVRAITPDDGVSSLYKITIWGEIVLYVSVLRETTQHCVEPDA